MTSLKTAILCLFICVVLYVTFVSSKQRHHKQRRQRRLVVVNQFRKKPATRLKEPERKLSLNSVRTNLSYKHGRKHARKNPEQKRRRNRRKLKRRRHRSKTGRLNRHQRNKAPRTEVIKEIELTIPELYSYLNPTSWREMLSTYIGPSNTRYLDGVVRLKRLYCRAGIGYHLEIKGDGSIAANHAQTPYSIVEIFSVKRSVVGIRSAKSSLYLCMNKAGKIYVQKTFQPECQFRENIEKNNFNTYASEMYSDHKNRKGYFLAISKRGKIPRRMKKGSWMRKRTHWLPRTI